MFVRDLPTRELLSIITRRRFSDEELTRPLLEMLKKPSEGGYYPTQLLAAGELMERAFCEQMRFCDAITHPESMRAYLRLYFAGKEHECFVAVFLNCQHVVIEAVELFRGTLNQTSVYPREVVKEALKRNASSVIFAHNHPSGSTTPSHADRSLTTRLKDSLALIDVCVMDHLVVSGTAIYSMAERGEL